MTVSVVKLSRIVIKKDTLNILALVSKIHSKKWKKLTVKIRKKIWCKMCENPLKNQLPRFLKTQPEPSQNPQTPARRTRHILRQFLSHLRCHNHSISRGRFIL